MGEPLTHTAGCHGRAAAARPSPTSGRCSSSWTRTPPRCSSAIAPASSWSYAQGGSHGNLATPAHPSKEYGTGELIDVPEALGSSTFTLTEGHLLTRDKVTFGVVFQGAGLQGHPAADPPGLGVVHQPQQRHRA
jgi:hypothetical protein